MLLLEGQGAIYLTSAKWSLIGVFTEIMTTDLWNWPHSITHLSSLSTRKAATVVSMIPSPYQGTTPMYWLVYMTVANQPPLRPRIITLSSNSFLFHLAAIYHVTYDACLLISSTLLTIRCVTRGMQLSIGVYYQAIKSKIINLTSCFIPTFIHGIFVIQAIV